jgi:hypothetical protein
MDKMFDQNLRPFQRGYDRDTLCRGIGQCRQAHTYNRHRSHAASRLELGAVEAGNDGGIDVGTFSCCDLGKQARSNTASSQ